MLCFATEAAAQAPTPREAALETRVHELELRLNELEAQLSVRSQRSRRADRTLDVQARARLPRATSRATAGPPPATAAPAAPAEATAEERPATGERETSDSGAASTAPSQPPEAKAVESSEVPQEFFVFRDNAVTLTHNRAEASASASYLRGVNVLQKEHGLLLDASLRYGVLDWLELGATVNGFWTERETDIPGRTVVGAIRAMGDTTLGGTAQLWQQSADYPGSALNISAIIPTGRSPYNFGPAYQTGDNPINPFLSMQSLGLWGVRSVAEFFKTVDPIVLFFGVGAEYRFDGTIQGHNVDVGTRFLYNGGLSFAFSEKTTLGLQVNGSALRGLRIDGRSVLQTSMEPVSLRTVIIQRIGADLWLEPSLTVGLTNEAPAVIVGVGLRDRF
jgi:hypothetical protein